MKVAVRSKSAEETRNVAAVLGRAALGQLAVLLRGDYGAGKTTFVQGLATGMGITDPVRSPSYNILKRYDGARVLIHADLYRTGSQADVAELAIGELLPPNGILAVEWPANHADYDVDAPVLYVDIGIPPNALGEGEDREPRELTFSCDDERCPIGLIEVLVAIAD